jgi:hypothetical protein
MRAAAVVAFALVACASDECPKWYVETGPGECVLPVAGGAAPKKEPAQTAGSVAWGGGIFEEKQDAGRGAGSGGALGGRGGVGGTGGGGGAGGSLVVTSGPTRMDAPAEHDPTEQPDAGVTVAPEPRCGDGHVDPGETCDGNCPLDCDDGELCTDESYVGRTATCDAKCIHTPRSEGAVCGFQVQGKFCFGGTCTKPVCGDGKIQGAEACDGDCSSRCEDNNPCTADVNVGADSCTVACSNKPATFAACPGGTCDENGKCQPNAR